MSHLRNLKQCKHILGTSSTLISTTPSEVIFIQSRLGPAIILKANLHIEQLSKNLQFMTNEKVTIHKNNQVLTASDSPRPLTLLYTWTLSKDRHVKKYAKYYTDRGIDVLRVKTLPYDILFPKQGARVVAGTVLDFLKINKAFNPIFVHGLSVGAYAFGELMLKTDQDDSKDEILNRFIGQIWDSAVDIYGLPEALGKAFATNPIVQASIEKYLRWYMNVNKEDFTKCLEDAAAHIYANTVKVPGLWIYSEADPVSPPSMNIQVYSKWIKRGEPTYHKCFKTSPHVSHFYKYTQEYEDAISAFSKHVGLLPITKKQRIALTN